MLLVWGFPLLAPTPLLSPLSSRLSPPSVEVGSPLLAALTPLPRRGSAGAGAAVPAAGGAHLRRLAPTRQSTKRKHTGARSSLPARHVWPPRQL